ncbi:MAG: hypothetical protein ACI4T3_04335 [Lactobacillus sp.]
MTEQEFRDKYSSLLHEFDEKYKSSDRLHHLLHDENFVNDLNQSKSNTETTIMIVAKMIEAENDRTNQLVGFMLKKFLNVKD